jgi:hypothetical protein
MTENSRLDTAAAAIVTRMITRRTLRVLRPVSPYKKTSEAWVAMAGWEKEELKLQLLKEWWIDASRSKCHEAS